ncbi:putative UDP-galactose/UDP-N-acetylglucosamine transporter srf-3 [Dictyocaulus viviparus]|uniref:Putative UDP-galactose/UDP-N-acetylglucosamine transporter srf-3 n=1 Tax=Dictyocaulus viviparus TaxID=29172 RepID=A0A0D8XHL2_DICVI|nr:putative UDP-galactose/UDP-N-acetylglucosamine transporter srf-3 [Dictyocaulus viviparus]
MPSDFSFKYGGLILLTLQQASMPLLTRYTRYRGESEIFFTTVNVFMMEIVKLCTCTAVIICSSNSVFRFFVELKEAICDNPIETVKVCIPAVIYTLQNNLYYIALTHLEATTFCVAYQMKIFSTALLMYFFLGKKLSVLQWIALVILVIGVVDVQLVYAPTASNEAIEQKPLLGFISVVVMCFTSAFAGVYLEKMLKSSATSVWMQNVRLALVGIPISIFSMFFYDWENIQKDGFFRGWDIFVVSLMVTNSVGGLLISIVIKYADNIMKAYAQSVAIIGAAIGSWLLFNFIPGFLFTIGTILVMISMVMYTTFPYEPPEFRYNRFSEKNTTLNATNSNEDHRKISGLTIRI